MYKRAVPILLLLVLSSFANGSDFATEVVSFTGPFGGWPYDDAYSVLGKPTTEIFDWMYFDTFACSLVYPACNTDPNDDSLVTTLGDGAEIVVRFDHQVADDAGNPYGIDFIVFGNSFFENGGYLEPYTDMNDYFLISPAAIYDEPVTVSVSADGENWYTYSGGPFADANFPTNAYAWDYESHCWGAELDWTKPVDPNLKISDFDGLSVARAIELYDGSAGGTGFDLAESGFEWIEYIKVQSTDFGEVDGFADVAGCGDYNHPYPVGDLSGDCRVDYDDVMLLCGYWLAEISGPDDPAAVADIYEDGVVDLFDWALMADSWGQCSWQCE